MKPNSVGIFKQPKKIFEFNMQIHLEPEKTQSSLYWP